MALSFFLFLFLFLRLLLRPDLPPAAELMVQTTPGEGLRSAEESYANESLGVCTGGVYWGCVLGY